MELFLELAVLLWAGCALSRLAAAGPVRQELKERPVLLGLAGLLAIIATGVFGFAWVDDGSGLRLLAGLAFVGSSAAWIRGRPAYGARRRWAPGSLGLATSLGSVTDPDFYAREARKHGPVFKMSQFHRPTVCIVDLPLGLGFLEDQADRLEQPRLDFAKAVPGNYIELMNGETHRQYRGILQPAFNGTVVRETRTELEGTIRAQLERMARDAERGGVDPSPYLDAMAFQSLLQVFFGVRPDSPEFETFRLAYDEIGGEGSVASVNSEELGAAVEAVAVKVRRLVGELQASSLHPSSILAAAIRAHPDHALDPVLIGNLVFMLQIARNNTNGFLGWVLKMASDHPVWLEKLRAEGEEGLATRMVSETLRLAQSEYAYRVVTRECTLGEYRIPKGWLVRVCLRECHRRADRFVDPESYDPDRFLHMTDGKYSFAPFGDGGHACFGAALVTSIARSFLLELAAGFDTEVVSDGPLERGNRHWNHWRPSRRFRIRLTKISQPREEVLPRVAQV